STPLATMILYGYVPSARRDIFTKRLDNAPTVLHDALNNNFSIAKSAKKKTITPCWLLHLQTTNPSASIVKNSLARLTTKTPSSGNSCFRVCALRQRLIE